MKLITLINIVSLVFLAACGGYSTSNETGAAYIGRSQQIDEEIIEVAKLRSNLHFPARIGVIKTGRYGVSSAFTEQEQKKWEAFITSHAHLGTFALVNSLSVREEFDQKANRMLAYRRAAARQHFDYILVYDVEKQSDRSSTALALADFTVIGGAILPTRRLDIELIGNASFIDVRNGYIYGTAQATVTEQAYLPSIGSRSRQNDIEKEAEMALFDKMSPYVQNMLDDLYKKSRDKP